MKLYELAAEWRNAEAQLDLDEDQYGQDDQALANLLDAVKEEATLKIAGIVRWIANEQAEAEGLAAEIARLQALKKSRENRARSLRCYLAEFMRGAGLEKFDAGIRKLHFRKGSASLEVDPREVHNWPAAVYDQAIKTGAIVEVIEVRKTGVKELPNYLTLPGVREVRGEDSLVIR